MISEFPDNEINKELATRLNNLVVESTTFPMFVSRVTSSSSKNYFLVSTQLNNPELNKCGNGWNNITDILVIVVKKKNVGSKALLNKATQAAISALDGFQLTTSTLNVSSVAFSIPIDLETERGGEVAYQKVIRMETIIR